MQSTRICKGDKVLILAGAAKNAVDEKGQPAVCTVLEVDRKTGRLILDLPRPRTKRGEREVPRRGIETWKTVRYNPKSGEAGGLKIVKRALHASNVKVVEKAPRREFGAR